MSWRIAQKDYFRAAFWKQQLAPVWYDQIAVFISART